MTVTCNPQLQLSTREVLDVAGANTATLQYKEYDRTSPKYNASSTPAVDTVASGVATLVAGALTLDLSAINDAIGGTTVDFTGKKIVVALFHNPSTAAITIAEGATNGYQLMGGANIVVPPSGTVVCDFADGLGDVGATDEELDLTGTGTDTLNFVFVGG